MAVHALIMGFGGTGAHILTYLKEIAVLKQGGKPEGIKFLLFDTLADWNPGETVQIMGGAGEEKVAKGNEEGTSLDPDSEYFYLKDDHPPLDSYAYQLLATGSSSANQYPHLKDWLHTAWLSRHIAKDKLNITDGAAQQRQIGRFAMFQNVRPILSFMERALRELKAQAGAGTIQVWIVGSAAGGTGAGSMLDAAFMARLASVNVGGAIQISGAMVLPSIYGDKGGISQGRAYALFRELDRFQEVGFGNRTDQRYLVNGRQTASEVVYDSSEHLHPLVEGRLFDNLFYLGIECQNDEERTAFFSSVANALDPYLDDNQGPSLLEQSVNNVGFAASSFGAARFYVPRQTLGELFAWQEARRFIHAITAPKMDGTMAIGLYSGEPADRQKQAKERVTQILPLFEELLKLEDMTPEKQRSFAKNSFDPSTIITKWYQLGAAGIGGMEANAAEIQKCKLAYIDPYLSLIEEDSEKVSPRDIVVKTYKESREAKGPKESEKNSRDRFALELDRVTQQYCGTGVGTLSEGRKLIVKIISKHIGDKIDSAIEERLERETGVAWNESQQNEGTAMTRLYEEIQWTGAENGPLDQISTVIANFLEAIDQEENYAGPQTAVDAVNTLKQIEPSGFGLFGTWVDEPQQIAREECLSFILWHQKRALLTDMRQLVDEAKNRLQQWSEAFYNHLIGELTISRAERKSALAIIDENIERLEGRLWRLARNDSARIDCTQGGGDDTMHGYRTVLQNFSVGEGNQRLSSQLLVECKWRLGYDNQQAPVIELHTPLEKPPRLGNIYQYLHDYFRREIETKLNERDIFDYLLYLRESKSIEPGKVVSLLNNAAKVLLTTSGTVPDVQWVYKEPNATAKKDFTSTLQTELINASTEVSVKDPQRLYSDLNSLTLMKIAKPSPDDVTSLYGAGGCRDDYILDQNDKESGDYNHDQDLYRAQVYHPFRPELEAWFIECDYAARTATLVGIKETDIPHISPRLTRLMEHPDMLQAFVRCIATGAVEKNDNDIWRFHSSGKGGDIDLTTDHEPTADVVRAAVIFTLRQLEGRDSGVKRILYKDAMQSAVDMAQKAGKNANVDDMVQTFVGKPENKARVELDDFLDSEDFFRTGGLQPRVVEQEKKNLKMIFQFYGNRKRRTHIGDRMELPR